MKKTFRLVLFVGMILSAGSTFAGQFDMPVPMPVCPPTGPCSVSIGQFDMPVPMPVCPPTGPCSTSASAR